MPEIRHKGNLRSLSDLRNLQHFWCYRIKNVPWGKWMEFPSPFPIPAILSSFMVEVVASWWARSESLKTSSNACFQVVEMMQDVFDMAKGGHSSMSCWKHLASCCWHGKGRTPLLAMPNISARCFRCGKGGTPLLTTRGHRDQKKVPRVDFFPKVSRGELTY